MQEIVTCTVCPRGCSIIVEGTTDSVTAISGQGCKRGKAFAAAEFTHSARILTSTVKVCGSGNEVLPVRSASPVPMEKLFDCTKGIQRFFRTDC